MTMWTIDDQYETMPWDELDAVVFDVGNVLLSYSPEADRGVNRFVCFRCIS